MKINVLSTYRNELMGIAILWIIFYHSPMHIQNSILTLIKNRGFIGVDIFLLMSGLGLYYSFLKQNDILKFYKKRIVRIFPIYIFVVSISSILNNDSIVSFLIKISTLGFWLNTDCYAWYISLIVILYLLFPVYMKIFIKKQTMVTVITSIVSFLMAGISTQIRDIINLQDLFLHIPIFILGIYWGYLCNNDIDKFPFKKIFTLSLISFVIGCFITFMGNIYLPEYKVCINPISCYFMTVTICLLLCRLLGAFNKNSKIICFLSYSGTISLELYLVHGQGYFDAITIFDKSPINRNILVMFFICVCYCLSIITHRVYGLFIQQLNNKKCKQESKQKA